ncbi:MAG: hypothetical protein ACJ72N_04065 [Labedaea sp.]
MEREQRGPDPNPYRAVWPMTPVGGTSGRRRIELRLVPGLIAALVVLMPFAVLAGYLWASGAATGGGVVTLLGLAGAFSMGAFVASDRS